MQLSALSAPSVVQSVAVGSSAQIHKHDPGQRCLACEASRRAMFVKIVPSTLFSEAAQAFIDARTLKVPNGRVRYISPRTLQDYAIFRNALNKFFGTLPLGQIDAGALTEYQRLRAIGGDNGIRWARPCSANKITKELGFLIRIKKLSGSWSQELEDQFCHLQHVESDIGYALTPPEQEHWLMVAAEVNPFIHWYSLVAIHSMARTNELRALRLRDINLYSEIFQVRSESAKNKFSIRTIPLTRDALWAMERLLERAKTFDAVLPHHFLFPFGSKGKTPERAMTVSGLKKRWAIVCEASGVKWRPSDTRHTGCTRMAEAGQNIHTIMSFAGHMSPRQQQHYIHIAEQVMRKGAVSAFEKKSVKGVRA